MSASTTGLLRCAAAISGWIELPPPISSAMTARKATPRCSSTRATARAMVRLSVRCSWPTSGAPHVRHRRDPGVVLERVGRHQRDAMALGVEAAHVEEPEIRAPAPAGAEDPGAD